MISKSTKLFAMRILPFKHLNMKICLNKEFTVDIGQTLAIFKPACWQAGFQILILFIFCQSASPASCSCWGIEV